jgi:hypothetical protein
MLPASLHKAYDEFGRPKFGGVRGEWDLSGGVNCGVENEQFLDSIEFGEFINVYIAFRHFGSLISYTFLNIKIRGDTLMFDVTEIVL